MITDDPCMPLTSPTVWLAIICGIVTLGNGIINTITIKFTHQSVTNQLTSVEKNIDGRMAQLIDSKTMQKEEAQ